MSKKFFFLFLFLLAFSASALAVEFSAESVANQRGVERKGKFFFKPDKIRMEQKQPDMITITRVDKKVVWSIMPKDKLYMEMKFAEDSRKPFTQEKMEGETERKAVGNETIQGHPTKKYLITYSKGNKTEQIYQWWATDIQFPIKTAAVDGSWSSEYRKIKIGPQPDSLFDIPAGFQKIQMPAGSAVQQ
ncbi:MAG: DUF4412 domain-containing protein [Thermodesulfovibrionales bacterium]|jgi:outer membrane lipoprotein-sorting protein